VMYAGEVMETADIDALFAEPAHPYTQGLLQSVPRLDRDDSGILRAIPGNPPDLVDLPTGCPFRARCPYAFDKCVEHPDLREAGEGRFKRCHLESLPEPEE